MATRKKKLNRKHFLAKLHSIESLLLNRGLTDSQVRKYALVQAREVIDLLNETTTTKPKRTESSIKEHAPSRNGDA